MNKLGLILGLVNTIAIAGVLGLFVYTKVIYKRPAITESQQRKRLIKTAPKAEATPVRKKAFINLDAIATNLDPYTGPDGKQKLHYVSVTLSVEIRDEKEVSRFDAIKPIVLDQILQQLGKKKFEDLNQVQGRYLFRSLIVDATNAYLKEPVVTDVFFTDFLLQ